VVDWRRSRTGVGAFRLTLYFGRRDRHTTAIFSAPDFLIQCSLRLCFTRLRDFILTGDLHLVYPAVKIKWMAWALAALLFVRFSSAQCRIAWRWWPHSRISDLFRPGDHLRGRGIAVSLGTPQAFFARVSQRNQTLHKCAVCGATELRRSHSTSWP
jgi:hypothetical protein